MLFLVTKAPVREDNQELLAISEFEPCSDRELKWVFLTYDYQTPYRQLSQNDRKEQAAEQVGYRRESVKRMDKTARQLINPELQKKHLPHIAPAIVAFNKMQRDLDREALQAYDQNLDDYMKKLKEPKNNKADWDLNIKISKTYKELVVGRKIIKDNLDLRSGFDEQEEDSTVAKKPKSTLDMVMEARRNK